MRPVSDWLINIIVFLLGGAILGRILYHGAPALASFVLGTSDATQAFLAVDALISFLVSVVFYCALYFIPRVHGLAVSLMLALCFFVYWGLESDIFTGDYNKRLPLWYEVNLAGAEFLAVLFSYRLVRMIKRSSAR